MKYMDTRKKSLVLKSKMEMNLLEENKYDDALVHDMVIFNVKSPLQEEILPGEKVVTPEIVQVRPNDPSRF